MDIGPAPSAPPSSPSLTPSADTKGLRRAFIVGVVLLALLAVVSQALVQQAIARQEGDARVINVAGSQRAASERLVKDALAVAYTADPVLAEEARAQFRATSTQFERVHRGLLVGDDQADFDPIADPEHLALLEAMSPDVDLLVGAASAMVDGDAVGDDLDARVESLWQAQQRFFAEMDGLVRALDEASAAEVAATGRTALSVFVATLVVLAALSLLSIRPALRGLAQSVRLFEALSDHAPDALLLADRRGVVFHHSVRAQELLGGDPGRLASIDELFDPPLAADVALALTSVNRFDGDTVPVRVNRARIEVAPGQTAELYSVHDRVAEIEAEQQQRQSEKLQAIGELAAGIAHEINTPTQFVRDNLVFLEESVGQLLSLAAQIDALVSTPTDGAAITGGTGDETVQARLADTVEDLDIEFLQEELRPAIAQSIEGMSRVAQIVKAMKDFSHPGSTTLDEANINEAIQTTAIIARNEWRYVADLDLDLDPGLPAVPVLLGDIKQVFLNLIVNAAHAIGSQEGDQRGQILIRSSVGEGEAVIEVIDDGPGIPAEIKNRIFEPFFTTKEVGKGTGQGLAIARRVVEQGHRGRIEIDKPAQGSGTVFRVRLPLVCPARQQAEEGVLTSA